MNKFLLAAVLILGISGVAFAAVEITDGTTRTKTESLVVSGPTMSVSGTNVTISTLAETGNKTITGNLTVTGTIVDSAIYTNAAGSYPNRLLTMGVDGTIYGTRTVLVDTSLYTASAGTGGSKALRISADGTIYAY